MEIKVGVGVKLNDNTVYDMNLNIPSGKLDAEHPFKFAITQTTVKNTEDSKKEDVLFLAFSDEEHICLRVSPPKSLLEEAKIDNYIDNLQAVVEEGEYIDANGCFLSKSGDSDTKSGDNPDPAQ